MAEVKLTKTQLNHKTSKGGTPRLYISPSWITNGHWMVGIDEVKDPARFSTVEVAKALFPRCEVFDQTDEIAQGVVDRIKTDLKWAVSSWVKSHSYGEPMRYLEGQDGRWAVISEYYRAMLEIEVGDILRGESETTPFLHNSRNVVIMPMQGDGENPS